MKYTMPESHKALLQAILAQLILQRDPEAELVYLVDPVADQVYLEDEDVS